MTPQALSLFCHQMPKVELHRHLEGSIRPELLLKMAYRNGIPLPFSDPSDYHQKCNFKSFNDFVPFFLLGVNCLQTAQDFTEIILDIGSQLHDDHIVYAELTFTPQFYLRLELGLDGVLEALNQGRDEVSRRWGIKIQWIPDLVRNRPAPAQRVVQWITSKTAKTGGVVALGLGGIEAGYPALDLAHLFHQAAAAGIPANPHAGEQGGADNIIDALDLLEAKRIGHGIRAVDSEHLLNRLAQEQVPLEVCISSNIKLGYSRDIYQHPVIKLLQAGCLVTLNTDDPILFRTTLSQEFVSLGKAINLTSDALETLTINAVQSTYLNELDKRELESKVRQSCSALRATLGED